MGERQLNENFLAWLAEQEPDAFVLLAVVRLRHAGNQYCEVPNMLVNLLGWNHEKRVKAARKGRGVRNGVEVGRGITLHHLPGRHGA